LDKPFGFGYVLPVGFLVKQFIARRTALSYMMV
jgi:hypothetical protein